MRCLVSEVESWVAFFATAVDLPDSTCPASRTPHRLTVQPYLCTPPTKPAPKVSLPTRPTIVSGKLPSHEGMVVTTTRRRHLSVSVVLRGYMMVRRHHGPLIALKHYPPPPKPPKPPTTHPRKVPPTPRFVESSEPHDVWDHRNLRAAICQDLPVSLCRGRAAIASRASAAKLVKHGLREVSFPLKTSEVFGRS